MITHKKIEIDNLFTTGFGANAPGPLVLSIDEGTFTHVQKKTATDASGQVEEVEISITKEYPSFELDIVPDDEFNVIYDVYLLEENNDDGVNIHVDRTEMGRNVIACYTESVPLLHSLTSFTVPPNTSDLSGIDITIRTLSLKGEGI